MNNIKRKFLVSADIQRWLKQQRSNIQKIEQFYTVSYADEVCYYHKLFPDTYTKVTVDKHGNKEITSVSEEVYVFHRKEHLGRIIVKNVYSVMIDGSTFVVEKYLKSLKGSIY